MGFRTNWVFGKGNHITDGLQGPAKHSLFRSTSGLRTKVGFENLFEESQ